mmetsp:Transcript_31317/g.82982  ORF Transcript_31317/g.82982 Transcript_31317/m.82982 type:complete len:268 (+) Transcript_31317:398-1201(+)
MFHRIPLGDHEEVHALLDVRRKLVTPLDVLSRVVDRDPQVSHQLRNAGVGQEPPGGVLNPGPRGQGHDADGRHGARRHQDVVHQPAVLIERLREGRVLGQARVLRAHRGARKHDLRQVSRRKERVVPIEYDEGSGNVLAARGRRAAPPERRPARERGAGFRVHGVRGGRRRQPTLPLGPVGVVSGQAWTPQRGLLGGEGEGLQHLGRFRSGALDLSQRMSRTATNGGDDVAQPAVDRDPVQPLLEVRAVGGGPDVVEAVLVLPRHGL